MMKRTRPQMQDYGINTVTDGMLDWAWVEAQMQQARNYWVSTTCPDGRPHAAPVWGIWWQSTFYFGTGKTSRKRRNLENNPAAVVHLESGDDVVIFEGTIIPAQLDATQRAQLLTEYSQKYGIAIGDIETGDYLQLLPVTVLAWKEADFPNTATRWVAET